MCAKSHEPRLAPYEVFKAPTRTMTTVTTPTKVCLDQALHTSDPYWRHKHNSTTASTPPRSVSSNITGAVQQHYRSPCSIYLPGWAQIDPFQPPHLLRATCSAHVSPAPQIEEEQIWECVEHL
jgi:hypothetical protein